MSNLCRLLDNGWDVTIHRGVDLRYHAYARRPFRQRWEDVLPQIECDTDEITGEVELKRTSDGIPSQCADADTPEGALNQLADKVFGLEAVS